MKKFSRNSVYYYSTFAASNNKTKQDKKLNVENTC